MKRIITIITTFGIALAGCGGDDATSVTQTTGEASVDQSSEDGSTVTDPSVAASSEADAEASSGDADAGDVIRTLDDIPQECRDQMAEFLREIEPTVAPIDWENASISDFESIADVFTAETAAFEAASDTAGCNDLAFEENGEFELLVEFAEQEVPGVVGFFQFLDLMRANSSPGSDVDTAVTLETCADGVDFIEGLMAEYDTIRDVPASQLATFQQLPQVFVTCTPEQVEFFDREDVDAFLSE